jgi:hypothetical protein
MTDLERKYSEAKSKYSCLRNEKNNDIFSNSELQRQKVEHGKDILLVELP